jgi:DNA-binding NtrC family response regulator
MTLRKLLCISIGKEDFQQLPASVALGWNVHNVYTLQDAARALKGQQFLVGLIVFKESTMAEVHKIQEFLDGHQQPQWLAIFSEQMLAWPETKALIVQHLFDFHTQPIDASRLSYALGHAYGFAQLQQTQASSLQKNDMDLVGQSEAIKQLRHQILKVAQANAPVLIAGESGTGKELTAQAIHRYSDRSQAPFIALNCGAIPAGLIQSELFGYERGAFTGAARDKRGLIESADRGTLFLDEIADLPLELQVNMLRFLQEGTINRVGSSQPIKVNVRVIAASHVLLEDAVRAGRFREDLMYRLNVLPLHVPALRERKEDLELLVQHFFELFKPEKNSRLQGWSQQAINSMRAYDWPGNVRELMNRIRRAMVMAEGRLITPQDLGLSVPAAETKLQIQGDALEDARIRAERDTIRDTFHRRGKNITHTARDLGVSRMTLYRLLEKHSLRH